MISGIKKRVFKQLTLFSIITSLLFLAFTWVIAFVVEDEVIYAVLNNEASYVQQTYKTTQKLPNARADFISIHQDQTSLPIAVQNQLKINERSKEFFTDDGHHFHIIKLKFYDHTSALLLADVPHLLVVSRMSKQLMLLFTIVFICCLLLAIFFAYWISILSVKPIVNLAKEITDANDVQQPVQLANYPDEIGFLASTLQSNMNDLRTTLRREKHFTRDVSHELRTPLTIIANELQLLNSQMQEHTNVNRMHEALNDINNTISVLFALARAESLQSEIIDLTAIFEQVVMDLYQEIEQRKIVLDMSLFEKAQAMGNQTLTKLLLNNLLTNALRYSTEHTIQITLTEKHFIIANAFEDSLFTVPTDHLLSSGIRSEKSTGLGHGLFLSQRIAENMGWKLTLHTDNNTFAITLYFK